MVFKVGLMTLRRPLQTPVADLVTAIRSMSGQIDGLELLTCGAVEPGAKHGPVDADIVSVLGFADAAAVAAFGPHPRHQELLELLRPLLAESLVFDHADPALFLDLTP